MYPHPFDQAPISREIWDQKYRLKAADGTPVDVSIEDTWWRVARAAAAAEKGGRRQRERWAQRFYNVLSDFTFLPAGRIIAGAGSGRRVTLFNCFVMGRIEDDLSSIFEQVKQAALTMQQGGGIGHDFSTLRPMGAPVRSTGADASGPVSFMDVWDAMCTTIMSAGSRRGAMMGTLRCDHPDIEAFIAAKASASRLRNFNLSVLVTDGFISAVREGRSWDLVFDGQTVRSLPARELWSKLMRATYTYAEPGVIFIDRINALNNLGYCEQINATNPCGEQPLPAYGACLLGSINLARLVRRPFEADAALDLPGLEERVRLAVRLLDNCIDVSSYPLPAQKQEAHAKRRIGLGVTGLADALILVGQRYDSPEATRTAEGWMAAIERAAYLASAELAADRGAFPLFEAARYLARPGIARLSRDVSDAIAAHGIRNGCLISVAPTGTISLLAGNVSSGVEPVFDLEYRRCVRQADGSSNELTVADFAYSLFRSRHGASAAASLPPAFVTAAQLPPRAHLEMQAALQRHVDSSISKTINCPADLPFDAFQDVYLEAYDLGLKGCTTYRPNPITGAVLSQPAAAPGAGERQPAMAEAAMVSSPQHKAPTAPEPAAAAGGRGADGPPGNAHPPPAATPARAVERVSGVVYMAKPLERDPVLAGYTYKLKWPASDHAIYVTINDMERDGRRCPFEIFINTKNLEHYAWTVALTRMISAVFRRGGDVSFVVEELKAVFDPQGGHWLGGRYVPSLLAAIGEVIEGHMRRIGFLPEDPGDEEAAPGVLSAGADPASRDVAAGFGGGREHGGGRPQLGAAFDAGRVGQQPRGGRSGGAPGRLCPRCARASLIKEEGCWVCKTCGYSRCG